MADAAIHKGKTRAGVRLSSSGAAQGSWWLWRILPLLLFIAMVVAFGIWLWPSLKQDIASIQLIVAIILSIFLSMLPAMICVVQNTTKKRQLNRLASMEHFPVGETVYFQAAKTTVDCVKMGGVDADYAAPLFVYFFILFVGFIITLIGYPFNDMFATPTVLLGGIRPRAEGDYAAYQLQTFAVLTMAFFASYIYSLGRLLDRINNNDLYPISLYYYAARIVIACVVAAVVRHTADVFGVSSSALLLLVGFGIGFAPDLFILALMRRAFQAMKIWGARDDPSPDSRPASLPLLMIDDLTREKIDRLNELGIDSAQTLARQNPFLLLPRLPYDLGLIVDWIGQAQLYALVKDGKLKMLREMLVRDATELHIRLCEDKTRSEVAGALGISDAAALALASQLDQDQSFVRLQQVRAAMLLPVARPDADVRQA